MGVLTSDHAALGSSVRTLVAELHGRRVPTFIARDEQDATKLSVVEHLTVGGAARSAALEQLSALMNAPNPRLTRVRGALERPRGIDVVSDFIDGELLAEVQASLASRGTPLATLCALRLISDILAGLHTLHGIPAFATTGHGRLSPRAVVVGLDGRVRLIELVRDRFEAPDDGLARFAAPEILAGGAPSARGDIFAAGALLVSLLEYNDAGNSSDVLPILAVAERAMAADPADRFESAAAMLSAIASTFREAPSHADVARMMSLAAGDQIRSRRVAAEKAPVLAGADVRDALAPPESMPIMYTAEPLPGSRNASPWPGALRAQPGVNSQPQASGPSSSPPSDRGPVSSQPPSSRRTDRPPPGFGHVPASDKPVPLGVVPPVVRASELPITAAPVSTRVVAAPPPAGPRPTSKPAVKASTPSSKPVVTAVAAAPVAAAPVAAAPVAAAPVAAAPVAAAPVAIAAPAPSGPPKKTTPAPQKALPAPPPSGSMPRLASTRPNPEAEHQAAPESRPLDSWRYASVKAVEPPRRAITLPVPDESIIVTEAPDAELERVQETTLAMRAPVSAPPSVRHIPSDPPQSTTSSKLPAFEVRAPRSPPKRTSRLLPMALGGIAFVGLAAGALTLLSRGKSTADGSSAVAARVAAPALPAAAAVPTAAATSRCPAGMVLLDGGTFTMGSDAADASIGARPAHSVTLGAFCIDMREVSLGKFKACSDSGDCKRGLVTNEWTGITPAEHAAYEPLCTLRNPAASAEHPINCVDWERADIYCAAQGARLPTEAEWEFAARGRDNRTYPWGEELPAASLVNGCGAECAAWATKNGLELPAAYEATDGWAGTAPGKTFPAGSTPEGVADLVGNVAEWVADAYVPYSAAAQTNPVTANGDLRVVRGGSFATGKRAALSATYRTREKPTKRSSTIGFRCASPVGASVVGK
jgi:formylglycine-generating enzyme required for sulfatase activity